MTSKPVCLVVGAGDALGGSIAFSGKAIIVKLAYRHGVDAVTLLMWRMLLALPLFVALAWWAGRDQPRLLGRDWRDIALLGFTGIAAFQTRNPMHRSHEYLAKIAVEVCDGLIRRLARPAPAPA